MNSHQVDHRRNLAVDVKELCGFRSFVPLVAQPYICIQEKKLIHSLRHIYFLNVVRSAVVAQQGCGDRYLLHELALKRQRIRRP